MMTSKLCQNIKKFKNMNPSVIYIGAKNFQEKSKDIIS